jgi:hypothetical protein
MGNISLFELAKQMKQLEDQMDIVTSKVATYIHNQNTPLDVWTITHNLGKLPSVTVVDSAENIVYGDIEYINNNAIVISFIGAFSGKAYLN